MQLSHQALPSEPEVQDRILNAAQCLFARQGFERTTTRELARMAGVAEGTLFRHFDSKKAILVAVATRGWVELLTDLLTELSGMGSYRAIAQLMRRRMLNLGPNADLMRVCFLEAQFHPDLRDRIQAEVITKMMDVAEAFVQTAMDQGIYRPLNPRVVAEVFLGMFTIAGFSQATLLEPDASPQARQEMAETLADIFLRGVLADPSSCGEQLGG